MTLLVFPDINVWLALVFSRHVHHPLAKGWFELLDDQTVLLFCRHTQLGLLRLLTTGSVMQADVKTQREAWTYYDAFLESGARLVPEPFGVEERFRRFSQLNSASPKGWADAYLTAFALAVGARLVTFDKALASSVQNSILL